MMETLITHGIRVSAEAVYQHTHSDPIGGKHLFSYNIWIENKSSFDVQLMSRHWYIFDSLQGMSEVEGEGVVGKQPLLKPGAVHFYTSWCPLNSEIGRMEGIFTMFNHHTGAYFDVKIPPFALIADIKLN